MPNRMGALHLAILATCISLAFGQQWHTLISFNAYLPSRSSSSVLFYEARRNYQLANLNATASPWRDAEVVCLQEVNLGEDRRSMEAHARQIGYQFSYTSGHVEAASDLRGAACTVPGVQRVQQCIATNCPDATSSAIAFAICAQTVCAEAVKGLRQTCVNCLLQAEGPLTSAITSCAIAQPAANFPTNFGLMILSKKRMWSPSLTAFQNYTQANRRGYIKATVDDIGVVYCTHNSPNTERSDSEALRLALAQANLQETQLLAAAARSPDSVILGDFNMGPAVASAGIEAVFPASFTHLESMGFRSPYVEQETPLCTFCPHNPMLALQVAQGTPFTANILDHIFLKPAQFEVRANSSMLIFAENAIQVTPQLAVPQSDHYGVKLTIRRRRHSRPYEAYLARKRDLLRRYGQTWYYE